MHILFTDCVFAQCDRLSNDPNKPVLGSGAYKC